MLDEILILQSRIMSTFFSFHRLLASVFWKSHRRPRVPVVVWLLGKNIDDLLFQIGKCFQLLRIQKVFIYFCYGHEGLYKVLQDHSLNVVTADYQLRSKFKYPLFIVNHCDVLMEQSWNYISVSIL